VKKVYTNKQYVLYWAGKTEDGPDYYGSNGTFNFRVLAIDAGGNVSEQQSIDIYIEWPSEIMCKNKKGTIRITNIGGTLSNGEHWKIYSVLAVKLVREGKVFYVEKPPGVGHRVRIILEYNSTYPYLKTEADGLKPNNLLSLPECIG